MQLIYYSLHKCRPTNGRLNPLDSKGNYIATSDNIKLVHWPLMSGLSHLVQRGGAWAGCGPCQSPLRCTKCNSPSINGQCTNHTSVPVSRSKGQRSGWPSPLMLTHGVHHIFRTARPMNCKLKLGIRMEDDDPHQPQAPWSPRSEVKVARSRDHSEPSWTNAVLVSLEAGGGILCRSNLAATLLVMSTIII